MRDIYPDFYREFKCIANRCEDSCCKDWDIDVDSETEKFYNTVNNPLGDKIRSLTYTDEYGERIFRALRLISVISGRIFCPLPAPRRRGLC